MSDIEEYYEGYWKKRLATTDESLPPIRDGIPSFLIRFTQYCSVVDQVPRDSKLLDLGCGQGNVTELYRVRKGSEIHALEISEEAIRHARMRGVKVVRWNLNDQGYPHPDASFDVIVSVDVPEHLINPIILLDESSRMFLFSVLVKYKDATFVNTAKLMIITPEGRVDGAVVNYLTTILGEQAVPLLYAKVKDENLTDDGDKMALGDAILKHVGTNPDSNAFFKEVITNKELGPLRFLALGHLTGGDRAESTLRNRQKLITDIKETSPEDESLNRALDGTHNRIEVMIDPSKAEELGTGNNGANFLQQFFNRGRQEKKNN